jgi:hypothetical protein
MSAAPWVTFARFNPVTSSFDRETTELHYAPPECFHMMWPATDDEIVAERARRGRDRQRNRELQARPEYEDAVAIGKMLSSMAHNRHPLDLLTPEQWSVLRKHLEGLL